MRDYLYIWNDPISRCIIASGIEFKDIAHLIGLNGGLVLLNCEVSMLLDTEIDTRANFDYVTMQRISELAKQDIYSLGDFCWVDYAGEDFPAISGQEIAEILYFAHMSEPLDEIALPSLNNKFLCYSHDDGWYLRLFYSHWEDAAVLVNTLYPLLNVAELKSGGTAYWITATTVEMEERTLDIDAILNRRITRPA